MIVLLPILLAPAVLAAIALGYCAVHCRGIARSIAMGFLIAYIFIIVMHFLPVPSNLWPIGLFVHGCIFLVPAVVIYVTTSLHAAKPSAIKSRPNTSENAE
jgi:hypothetical protein